MTFAKIYFIVLGLLQQIVLPRVLGMGGYGALSNVLSLASVAYNPVITTSIQGVSRTVAQAPDATRAQAMRRALSIHALLAVPLAAGFFFAAGPVARLINAPHLAGGLRILAGVMLCYALYAPLIGVLNGRQRFVQQAAFDVLAATLRTVGLIAGAWYFANFFDKGTEGAASGFLASAVGVLLMAALVVGFGRPGAEQPTVRGYLAFVGSLFVGHALLNVLLQADLTLLRAFAGEAALNAGLPATAADDYVGAYRATQLFCFLPYQLLISITFILFPMLARAFRDGDQAAVARYVQTGMRLALVFAGAMVSVTSGLSGPLLRLVFPAPAAEYGTTAMQLLTLGFGAFALLGVLITVLNSLQRERRSAQIMGLAVLLVAALCTLLVRGAPLDAGLLLRTATATTVGLVLATVSAAWFVRRAAGAVVAPTSLLRVGVAVALSITLGRLLPEPGKVLTLAYALLVAGSYATLLILTRELGSADLQLVRRVLGRAKS